MSEDGNKTLKRCPSCGGVAEYDNDSYGSWVSCESCGIRTSGCSWGSNSCIYDEWNSQPERDRVEKENTKLRELLVKISLNSSFQTNMPHEADLVCALLTKLQSEG